MLSEARREEIFDAVGRWCLAWSVGHATAGECDEWGMTEALRVAARRALDGLEAVPDALLIDGPVDLLRHRDEPFAGTVRPVVDGDAKCASVAAASVLAKVVRDRLMREEALHFPAYGFERNKGYPSPLHQAALRGYGPSAIHRRSWAFVDELPYRGQPPRPRLGLGPEDQPTLFDQGGSDDGADLGKVTRHWVPLTPLDELGFLGGTDLLRLPAAGTEAAAGGG